MKISKYTLTLILSAFIFLGVACSSSSDENTSFTDNSTENAEAESDTTNSEETSTEQVALSEVAKKGEAIFNLNCIACHMITEEKVIGPGLQGVTKRREKEWIKKFVKNSQAVIESGDEYAVKLYEEYNKTLMTSFNFTDEEFESLYAYLEANSQ